MAALFSVNEARQHHEGGVSLRKLMWFTLGFAFICALWAYVQAQDWYLPALIAAAVLCAVFSLASLRWKWARRPAVSFLGIAVGICWIFVFTRYYLLPAAELDGQELTTTFTASDYSYETDYGIGVDGQVTVSGNVYQIRLYLDVDHTVSPGDRITGTFRCRLTTSQGAEGSTYHAGNGVFLLGYATGPVERIHAAEMTLMQKAAVLRSQIVGILNSVFSEDVAVFARALLLGDTYDLDYETDTAFKISGIRHIVAVSGLHVTILFSMLDTVALKNRYLTAVLSYPVLFLFAAVAGFTASVTRACIMVGLMILSRLLRRSYDSATALAFAVLVMLVRNPLTITAVGFQLSVGCVAGILLFSPRIQAWLLERMIRKGMHRLTYKLVEFFAASVSVTLGAMSLTTPLCAYYFGTVSLIGPVTNLVTLWAVNLAFNGIVAVCILYLISPWLASGLAWLIGWLMRCIIAAAKLLASVPLAAVYTKSVYIVLWLIFCYLLLTVFYFSRDRRPAFLVCCAAIGLCTALLASWIEPMLDHTRVTVLDVGQGQCILIQSGGKRFLIDCGGDRDEAAADVTAETLLSQGIRRLDGIIITHTDRDHAGGIPYLLSRIDTELILYPATDTLMELPEDSAGTVLPVGQDLQMSYGSVNVTVFGPTFVKESNENSLCVLFCTEKCDILITGDRGAFGEAMLLQRMGAQDVDLLIAGHHGSKYSTGEALLSAVTPETVVISVGESNLYGHPAGELLERLEKYGCRTYRTDQHGTVIYRR